MEKISIGFFKSKAMAMALPLPLLPFSLRMKHIP
jgi:hypothetical protein